MTTFFMCARPFNDILLQYMMTLCVHGPLIFCYSQYIMTSFVYMVLYKYSATL